jgi:hypothetical protein
VTVVGMAIPCLEHEQVDEIKSSHGEAVLERMVSGLAGSASGEAISLKDILKWPSEPDRSLISREEDECRVASNRHQLTIGADGCFAHLHRFLVCPSMAHLHLCEQTEILADIACKTYPCGKKSPVCAQKPNNGLDPAVWLS